MIRTLTTTAPSVQLSTIQTYFTPTASFTHPFCRTGSFSIKDAFFATSLSFNSRWLIIQIYRWYKILSPHIELSVDSVAFDSQNMLLYVGIHQLFKIQLIPYYAAPVKLTTVLTLTHDPAGLGRAPRRLEREEPRSLSSKYYIQSQNDLYQTSEFVKFAVPWGFGITAVMFWHFFATLMCVVGATVFSPVTWIEQWWTRSNTPGLSDKHCT